MEKREALGKLVGYTNVLKRKNDTSNQCAPPNLLSTFLSLSPLMEDWKGRPVGYSTLEMEDISNGYYRSKKDVKHGRLIG